MRTHHLFISHSWKYANQYEQLKKLLEKRGYFEFHNYSVPRDNPIQGARTDAQLEDAIRRKMRSCGAVLILAGVYASYSKWINKEIELAKQDFEKPKPIIAIEPWGSEKTSRPVKLAADRRVGWNTESIVRAIRELA